MLKPTISNTFPAAIPPLPFWRRPSVLAGAGTFILILSYVIFVKVTTPTEEELALKNSEWVTVKRGDFEIVCREEGELRPVKVTAMQFLRDGRVGYLLPEGTNVKKGEKIIGLETAELEEEIQHMQEDVAASERSLAQQEQQRLLDTEQLNAEQATERARVEVARLRVEELESHPLPTEKIEADNLLASADVRRTAAREELDAYLPLYDKGFGNRTDLEAKKVSVERSKLEYERAEMKAAQLRRGAKDDERQEVKQQYEQAKLDLKVKDLTMTSQLEALNLKVRASQRSLALQKRKLDRRKQHLEQSFLYAPHDGIVVYRLMDYRNNRKVEIGERMSTWWSPIELPNYDRMKVRTQVPESFIRKIRARSAQEGGSETRPGSSARVRVKTVSGRMYEGEVSWIDGWSRDRNSKLSDADIRVQGLSGVNVFDVEVELKESDPERLREGFRAIVEFPVEVLKSVIAIPVSGVIARSGTTYVRLYDTGELRQVSLGRQCMDQVVVLDGLQEGERVAVPRRMETKPEAPISSGGANDAAAAQTPGAFSAGGTGGSSSSGSGSGGSGSGGERPAKGEGRVREGDAPAKREGDTPAKREGAPREKSSGKSRRPKQ